MRVHIEELNFGKEADVARVQEILQLAFAKPPWNTYGAPANWNVVVQGWRLPGTKVFIAKRQGQIVGVGAGQLNRPKSIPAEVLKKLGQGKHYELHTIAVDPKKKSRQIGTALQQTLEQHAVSLGCTTAFGETHPKNRVMIHLFTKKRFHKFHEASNRAYYKKTLEVKPAPIQIEELDLHNEGDVNQVAEMFRKAFSPELPHKSAFQAWRSIVKSYKNVEREFLPKNFVARHNGKIVGATFGKLHDKRDHVPEVDEKLGVGKHYYMAGLVVDPEQQKRGIASELNKRIAEHAKQLRCKTLYGYTYSERGKMVRMFEGEGFHTFHTHSTSEGTRLYYRKQL